MEGSWVRSPHTADHFQANVTSTSPLKASVDCRLPTSDSLEIYLSWDQIPIYIWDESGHHLPTYKPYLYQKSMANTPSGCLEMCLVELAQLVEHSTCNGGVVGSIPRHGRPFQANVASTCPLKASVDCRLPTSDSLEMYLSWDQIPIYIWDESCHHLPTYKT